METFARFLLGVALWFFDALGLWAAFSVTHSLDSRVPDFGYWTCFVLIAVAWWIFKGFSAALEKD